MLARKGPPISLFDLTTARRTAFIFCSKVRAVLICAVGCNDYQAAIGEFWRHAVADELAG